MTELNPEHNSEPARRTRRNIAAAGVIVATALLAGVKPAKARPSPTCFLRGTTVLTSAGERPIEDLVIGDTLPTLFSGARPIQWITGCRSRRSNRDQPWVKSVLPVRVACSALGPDLPTTDLYLTQGHKLYIDGVLVPVGDLVNGTTIALHDDDLNELDYFNIKLETHDVIYAQGLACETQLRVDERANNFTDYLRRHGEPDIADQPCAPVLAYLGGRGQLKSRIRSALSPWIDRRLQIDVIRDRLEELAFGRARPLEVAALGHH